MSLLVSAISALGLLLVFSGVTRGPLRRTRSGPLQTLDRLAAEAGFRRIRALPLLGLCMVGASGGFLVGAALSPLLLLQCTLSTAGGIAPVAVARSRRAKLRDSLRHAWPDVLVDLISGVRAGVPLSECCCALAHRGPKELREGFAAFAATYGATGSFDSALTRLQNALEDPVADRVVAVLRMTHEVGGNDLVRVLGTATELIREDLRIRGEIRARWSWTVTAARLAAGAPFAVLSIMGVRPEAAAAYTSEAGTVTILVGTATTALGYRLMLRAARLPEERRIG